MIDVDNFTDWLLRDLIGALLFLLVPASHKLYSNYLFSFYTKQYSFTTKTGFLRMVNV
jgi:hypothetical protein